MNIVIKLAAIALVNFLFWRLINAGHNLAAAAVLMAVVIGVDYLHASCTTPRCRAVRRLIQLVCASVSFYLSSTIIRENENAIFVIMPFILAVLTFLIAIHIAFSWRTLLDDLQDDSDR